MLFRSAERLLGDDALASVEELVAQSLLTVLDPGPGAPLRYRMLETVREFGRMQLVDAGEQAEAQAAHQAWAVAYADRYGPAIFSRDQVATIDAVAVEENNLADALRKALAAPDPDAVVALMALLGGFWSIRGEHARVIMLCEPLAAAVAGYEPGPGRADQTRAALSLTLVNSWVAQLDVLTEVHARLAALGPGTTSPRIAAIVTVVLGARDSGNTHDAVEALESDDPMVRGVALQWSSHARENAGDIEGAVEAAEQALEVVTEDTGPWSRAVLHTQLAGLYSQLGMVDRAEPHARAATPVLARLGAREDALQAMTVSAVAALLRGDPDAAERVLDDVAAYADGDYSGGIGTEGTVLATRAEIAFARGDVDEGCRIVRQAATTMSALRFPGMGRDADLAPWTIYGNGVAAVALATHGRDDDGADLYAWLGAAAPRVLARERGFVDMPVVGLLLFALGTWALRKRALADADAVRLLVLAERCAYPRFIPTLDWHHVATLAEEREPGFVTLTLRPSTVCGYAPRLRLDLSVNILTNHAVNKGKITVFGGAQLRPNFHVRDCAELYVKCLALPAAQIDGKVFNAGYQNYSVAETAEVVRTVVQEEMPEKGEIEIVTTPSDDIRSYRINSDKIQRVLGFVPRHTIEDGARDLIKAFKAGKLPDSMSDTRYSNIKTMKAVHLK